MIQSICDVVTSPLVEIDDYKRNVDSCERDGGDLEDPATKLPRLLHSLKNAYYGMSVPHEIADAFLKAKLQLIKMWEMFLITSSEDKLPTDLVSLPDLKRVVVLPKRGELITDKIDFVNLLGLNSSFKRVSPGSKPPIGYKIARTGVYVPKSARAALSEFFLEIHALEDLTIVKSKMSPVEIKMKLDSLISQCYVEGALEQIPEDDLEIRKLGLVEFMLKLLGELYLLNRLIPPINMEDLGELVSLRIQNCSGAQNFPEGYIDEILSGGEYISREIYIEIQNSLDKFIKTLDLHDKEEQECLKLKMLSDVFDSVSDSYSDENAPESFPFNDLDSFMKANSDKDFRTMILGLFQYIIREEDEHSEEEVLIESSTFFEGGGGSASGSSNGLDVKILMEKPKVKPADLAVDDPVKVTRGFGLRSMFPHLREIVICLEEGKSRDFSRALIEVRSIIDIIGESKGYKRDMILDKESGVLVLKFPAGLLNDENELKFFNLLAVQIQIMADNDSSEKDLYQSNLIELANYKASIEKYFVLHPQYQELTPYLDTFLTILSTFQEARHISKKIRNY